MARDNIISFLDNVGSARQRVADAKLNSVLTRLRELSASVLPRLMQDLFENLDDDLFKLADKSASDLLQTRYFEAMRELRKLRHPIQDATLRAMLNRHDAFWGGQAAEQLSALEVDSEELTLVTEEDLEENLAVTAVVTKAENRFHNALYALGQRFGHLLGTGEVSPGDNPVGPRALAEAFHHALNLWHGELPVKLVIFKLFERHVMNYVGGLYDDMNDVLVAADVLPKIVQEVKRHPIAPSVKRARGESDAKAQEEAAAATRRSEVDLSTNLLGVITDLLASHRSSGGGGGGGDVRLLQLPVVSSAQLVDALNALQRDSLGEPVSTLTEAQEIRHGLQGNLSQHLELGSGEHAIKRLDQPDQDILDVITMLFDFILDDPNLPDAMKALLSRLQIPMVKVAMLDKSFFSQKLHPARRLLNNLAHAVIGWVDDGDRSPQSLYARVESVVTRVLTDFANDIELFDALDKEFSSFQEREARSAQVAEERMNQVTRGQEHLRVARRRVEEVIRGCLADLEGLPEPATNLLNEPWRDVLLLAYLREGEESETWKDAVAVAHRLVWSVIPKLEQQERQELLKVIPELLREMRGGLANISYDQHKAASLFKQLQACHISALRGKAQDTSRLTRPMLQEDEVKASPPAALQDDHYHKACNLAIGQWLEWQQGDHILRGKLSWKSEITGSLVFVNRKGLKNAEMHLDELAASLRDGTASLLDETGAPLLDRALIALLDALKSTSPAPNPA
jgi:hypothetical protein